MLCNEPWCLKPADIRTMTPYIVRRLFFARRDDRGQILLIGEEAVSAFDIFRQQWERFGAPEWRIRKAWAKLKGKWNAERKDE